MRTRHKPPTLVSMWMLDVFCCALGCMILLFVLATVQAQLNAMKVQLRTADAERSDARVRKLSADLKSTSAELSSTGKELDKTRTDLNARIASLEDQLRTAEDALVAKGKELKAATDSLDTTKTQLKTATDDRDALAKRLADAKASLNTVTVDRDALAKLLADANAEITTAAAIEDQLQDDLRKRAKTVKDTEAALAKAKTEEDELLKLLKNTKAAAEVVLADKERAAKLLADMDARYQTLQKDKDTAAAAAGKVDDELKAARGVIRDLQKKFDDRNAVVIDLTEKNKGLQSTADKLKAESETRFAGIAMTGKKVVFIVDTSGSMKAVDGNTPEKTKWPGVVETVGKVMKSLPELEQFQVIAFGPKAAYLFGNGEWQEFKGAESAKAVTDKLAAIDPDGGTNLYEAFDLTFKLRATGMDTVYLFSDGLPNQGASGMTAADERALLTSTLGKEQKEAQLSQAQGKHLRATLKGTWNAADKDGKRVRINSIGFFYDSPDLGAFLWALSRENNGSFVGMSKP